MHANPRFVTAATIALAASVSPMYAQFCGFSGPTTTALSGIRKTLGDHHRDTAITAHNFAQFLAGTRQHAEAATHYRMALEVYRGLYGPDHRDVLNITSRLAAALLAANQLDEAHDAYEQLLLATRRVHGDNHERAIVVLQALADLCNRRGHTDEAASWQAQADHASAKASNATSRPDAATD